MASKNLRRLCQSVLPAEFSQVKQMLPAMQRFLEQNLPESVNQSVTLLTVNREHIVVAAHSPMVTHFLRLHSAEIQQQLQETFDLVQTLKLCTLPDSLLKLDSRDTPGKPQPVSQQSVDALTRGAEWIDNEDLKAAMLSLAETLNKAD